MSKTVVYTGKAIAEEYKMLQDMKSSYETGIGELTGAFLTNADYALKLLKMGLDEVNAEIARVEKLTYVFVSERE